MLKGCKMQNLSFSIPNTSVAIRATITFLQTMDDSLNSTEPLPNIHSEPTIVTTTSVVTPPPPATEVEPEDAPFVGTVDSEGMPWDERIHASTKSVIANGTWKLKRGVDQALVAQVKAELMGNDTSATPNSESTPPPPAEPITEATPPPPTPAPATPSVDGFRQLVSDITKAGLAPDYVQGICHDLGFKGIIDCKGSEENLNLLRMSLGL